jgi:hypothetical protein
MMPSFVISYVPTVENVDNITNLEKVQKVELVDKVTEVTNVKTVEQVNNVQNVEWVNTVDNVNTVHDVRKLPHPYFPLKKFNYQYGGWIHATTQNTYQAVYLPEYDCEFKGVQMSCIAYNIEDTYDVMIGSRYVIKGSHVKEMAEFRMLEVYEDVPAGTPITIEFHNNSELEKYLMFEFVCLFDEETVNYPGVMSWNFNWDGTAQYVAEQDDCVLVINQPNYVNMDSSIRDFHLEITDLTSQQLIATILCDASGGISSNYEEAEVEYQGTGYLGRVGVIAILSVTRFEKSIQVVFRNISDLGTTSPHPIEIGIYGLVNNVINGGV